MFFNSLIFYLVVYLFICNSNSPLQMMLYYISHLSQMLLFRDTFPALFTSLDITQKNRINNVIIIIFKVFS